MLLFGPPNIRHMHSRRDVRGLVRALGYKRAWKIRMEAAKALGELGDPVAVEALSAALHDPEAGVRAAAARALGGIGDERAVAPLLAVLGKKVTFGYGGAPIHAFAAERDAKTAARDALVRLGAVAVAPLCTALTQPAADAASAAAHARGKIGDRRVVPALCAALQDRRPGVSLAAAQALGEMRDRAAVGPLCQALRCSDPSMQLQAAHALGRIAEACAPEQIDEPGLAEHLCDLLEHGDNAARRTAAWALGCISNGAALGVRPAAPEDATSTVGAAAVEAPGQIGYLRTLGLLCKALGDESPGVREAAAEALGRAGDQRAQSALLAAARDPVPAVQAAAAEALGRLGNPGAVELLCEMTRGQAWSVRRAAARALVALYQGGKLDEPARQRILALRDAMATPHTDISHECGHEDHGTGVSL
jgi:HEAT repeat protein